MKRILLISFVLMASLISEAWAQRTVSGTVTSSTDGEGMPGVTVRAKGTSTGVNTDFNGNYRLEVPEGSNTLVFSFVGFTTQEVAIGNRSVVDVELEEDITQLQEVVVTGYGRRSSRELTSSIAQVSGKEIAQVPLPDVGQLIQGRATGVMSTVGTGQPGAVAQIRIRGTGSISAGQEPLYVIDGIIVNNDDLSAFDNTGGTAASNRLNPLSNLNPNNIESINVLKDAAATALYGARAANGVIVITTKKGASGATKINLNTQYGVTEQNQGSYRPLNAEELLAYDRQALENIGLTQERINELRPPSLADTDTDWVDEAFRSGVTQSYDLSISGGSDETRFFLSGGYFDQEGILLGSEFKRYSSRFNIDHSVNDKLDLGLNFNVSFADRLSASPGNQFNSPLLGAYLNSPWDSPRDPETGELVSGINFSTFIQDNFVRTTALNPNESGTLRTLGNLSASYEIIPDLSFTTKLGLDYVDLDEYFYTDLTTPDGFDADGRLTQTFTNNVTVTTQNILSYNKVINQKHNIDALAGYEFQNFRREAFVATGTGFASGALRTLNSAAVPESASGFNTEYSFLSYLSQVNYMYNGNYSVNLSFRRDGSSRFGANNRFANFYAIGGSWLISEESFLNSENSALSILKLRGSYGTSGNADIDNFGSLPLYAYNVAYNGVPASRPSQIGNPNLTWETTSSANIGVDYGFWDRINGSVDVYRRVSKDLLLDVPISATSGFTSDLRNIGKVQNQGIEFKLTTQNLVGDFRWTTDFMISSNQNEILELYQGQDISGSLTLNREGEEVSSFYLREYAGADPETGRPRWKDGEGGYTLNYAEAPRVVVGSPEPDFFGSFTNTFSFKGFDLSAFFYFVQGNKLYNDTGRLVDSDGAFFGLNQSAAVLEDRWEQPGDEAFRPQLLAGGNGNATSASTRYLEDASYIRLRNVNIGYNISPNLMERIGLNTARVYVQGVNLFTITDYTGFDPELAQNGIEFFRYPNGRTVTFGLNIGL